MITGFHLARYICCISTFFFILAYPVSRVHSHRRGSITSVLCERAIWMPQNNVSCRLREFLRCLNMRSSKKDVTGGGVRGCRLDAPNLFLKRHPKLKKRLLATYRKWLDNRYILSTGNVSNGRNDAPRPWAAWQSLVLQIYRQLDEFVGWTRFFSTRVNLGYRDILSLDKD